MNDILKIKNLGFEYKKNESVLKDISFSTNEGEIIGILGRNGCGKTTLLNIIAGFQKEYSGNVFINDNDIKEMSVSDRAKIFSYIQQKNFSIPDYYIVNDFVLEGRRPFRKFGFYKVEDYKLLNEVLNECNLVSYKNRKLNELSGGEIQRCIFARAIMKKSNLYLFDEPCSAMDIKYQKDFFSLTKKVREKTHSTFLITIHDINLAVQNCDRIILLDTGKIIYDGKANDITESVLNKAFYIKVSKNPLYEVNFYY